MSASEITPFGFEERQDLGLRAFAFGTVPNGVHGETTSASFAIVDRQIVCIVPCGYFRAGLPEVANEREALDVLLHHQDAKDRGFIVALYSATRCT